MNLPMPRQGFPWPIAWMSYLLTKPRELPDVTRQEIVSLQAKRVIILGGTGAVSAEIESLLEDEIGLTVERLSGSNRYATAAAIAHRMQAEGRFKVRRLLPMAQSFPMPWPHPPMLPRQAIQLAQRDEVPWQPNRFSRN